MNILKKGLAALLCVPLLTGCAGSRDNAVQEESVVDSRAKQEIEALADVSAELTAWSVYWDNSDDIDVLRDEADNVDAVSVFAASFKDGDVVIPEAADRMLGKIRRRDATADKKVYLSVVNDVEEGGKQTQKDTEILKNVIGTDEAAQEHAQKLVELASENGYDGIEIDYEKIRSDLDLWRDFINFEQKLLKLADDAGLRVRIVLEPSTPVEELEFPSGAEYVIMCYNLYGSGTVPGPKADMEFLGQMYDKFHKLPNISYALANGGYIWEGDTQKASQCRAEEAASLAKAADAEPERDDESGALHFSYKESGKEYTVWYADETTLAMWAQKLNELNGAAVPISLWRL